MGIGRIDFGGLGEISDSTRYFAPAEETRKSNQANGVLWRGFDTCRSGDVGIQGNPRKLDGGKSRDGPRNVGPQKAICPQSPSTSAGAVIPLQLPFAATDYGVERP